MAYVHLISHYIGKTAVTLCGLRGKALTITNRYQGASCAKCRDISREREGK